MAYATVEDVSRGWRDLTPAEEVRAVTLLDDAALKIDSYRPNADEACKAYVSKAMVRRVLDVDDPMPYESTTMTAGPYSRSYTLAGPNGGLYLTRDDKLMLRGSVGAVAFAPAYLGGE